MARYRLSVRINGTRKYTLLYRRWKDIRSRLQGRSTKRPDLYEGLKLGWKSFAEFRAWALNEASPRFSKRLSSPDRLHPKYGYIPGNVTFTTTKNNAMRAIHGDDWRDDWRGDGPAHEPDCDCDVCLPF